MEHFALVSSRPEEQRIFVHFSFSDPQVDDLLLALTQMFDVVTLESFPSAKPSLEAINDLMSAVHGVVILVPAPSAAGRMDCIFVAGIAVGQGLPVVLVSSDGRVSKLVAELPTLLYDQIASVGQALFTPASYSRREGRPQSQLDFGEPAVDYSSMRAATDQDLISQDAELGNWNRFLAMTERELVRTIGALFTDSGARVRSVEPSLRAGSPAVERADLVIWDESLLATFGLPLPVEVLLRPKNPAALRSRLQRTLKASGAKSLLAVAADLSRDIRWEVREGLILLVSASSLEAALNRASIADALSVLLAGARP